MIIKAFQEYGEDCVNYFNGMWAFVIWNKKKKNFFFLEIDLEKSHFIIFEIKKILFLDLKLNLLRTF